MKIVILPNFMKIIVPRNAFVLFVFFVDSNSHLT